MRGASDDAFQNATVTSNTAVIASRNSADLFTSGSPVSNENIIYEDKNDSTTSFVDFNISNAISLTNLVVGLPNDGPPDNRRSVVNIKVYAGLSAGTVLESLVADIPVDQTYTASYGDNEIKVNIDFTTPINAQYFRVEFEEPDAVFGARIYEIDGYGAPYIESAGQPEAIALPDLPSGEL